MCFDHLKQYDINPELEHVNVVLIHNENIAIQMMLNVAASQSRKVKNSRNLSMTRGSPTSRYRDLHVLDSCRVFLLSIKGGLARCYVLYCILIFLSKRDGFVLFSCIFDIHVVFMYFLVFSLLLVFAGFDIFACSFAIGFCSVLDMLDYLRVFLYILGGFGEMLCVFVYFCYWVL